MPNAVRGLPAACSRRLLPAVGCVILSTTGLVLGYSAPAVAHAGSTSGSNTPSNTVTMTTYQSAHAAASKAASKATSHAVKKAAKKPAATPNVVPSCNQHVKAGHFTCFALRRTDVPAVTGSTGRAFGPQTLRSQTFVAQTAVAGLTPANLAAAYSLPTATHGTGQTVYVVDAFGYPNAESDLASYRSQFGLPVCSTANGCFRKLNQLGQTSPLPGTDPGWAGETALDLDMISAVCPNCHITLIESDDDSNKMLDAVKEARTLGAQFVSMSWGGVENGHDASYDSTYFAKTGVVYTASSGDDGYSAGVIYPATSSRVVAVGGTSLKTSTNSRGWTESAWSGAGSGCSDEEARPSWQVAGTYCSRRGTTDVSAVANPNTGVAVYITQPGGGFQIGWNIFGGTSASAPIIAATYALAGTPQSATSPAKYLYQHPGSLYDITSGSNGSCSGSGLCHAVAGWDGPTGLGTPHGLTAFGPSRASNASTVISPASGGSGTQSDGSVLPTRGPAG